jgi:hypothetical protein
MGTSEENIANKKAVLKEVASWSDGPAVKVPSNVTGNPPTKPVANMAADQAQKATDLALTRMNQ